VGVLLLLADPPLLAGHVLPALDLLPHEVHVLPREASALLDPPVCDCLLVDGRDSLSSVRGLCRLVRQTGIQVPLLLVVTEGALAAVSADWGVDEVLLTTADPAEVEFRLRWSREQLSDSSPVDVGSHLVGGGGLTVDEATYAARVAERDLDLTFKEFELLKFLAQHPGRVFTRQQLLDELWGMDYFGGTRTVDVHIRRLRAKLGTDHDHLIGTVRNVGYRFVLPRTPSSPSRAVQVPVRSVPAGP
jgi:DNA-binding response OmpR family regulator